MYLFAGCQWLRPLILATQEAEIRRIVVWSQAGQTVARPYLEKNPSQKREEGAGEVAQGVGPEFKPQYHQKPNKKKVPFLKNWVVPAIFLFSFVFI
jgi:hypothetical protein